MKIRKLKGIDCLTSNKGHVIVNNLTQEQIQDFEKYKNKTAIKIDTRGERK